MWRLLALILASASAVHAETYKWIDERGVVNYSNTPPPAAAKSAQSVADRVSTYETDASLRASVARGATPHEMMAHQEWMQRQRLMHEAELVRASYAAPVDDYPVYSYPLYAGYPYGYSRTQVKKRPTSVRRGAHASHHRRF